jgi:hypothetical protein
MYVSYNSIDKSIKTKVPWLVKSLPVLSLIVAEALDNLVSKRLSDKIVVTFEFCYFPNDHTEALIEYTDDNFRPREFLMTLNVAKFKEPWEMFMAACHETIHIKQYATGELYQYARKWRTMRWQGKPYALHRNNKPLPFKEAAQMPWEVEAYNGEGPLFIKIIEKMDKYLHAIGRH